MEGNTPNGETTPTQPLSNNGGATATPVVNAVDTAEVEKARKEAEQARMRAAQLENELKKREEAEAAAKAKQLEEKEEFKTLYEQTQSQLNEIKAAQEAQERASQLNQATQEVFKDYDPKAVELAKVAGLSLTDDSETAVAALKEKLDVFQSQVGTGQSAGASNPRQTAPVKVSREELTARDADGISKLALASAKGDESVIRDYIKEIPAVQRMREIALNGN